MSTYSPLRGKANVSWIPQIKKCNTGAPINFCKIRFLIRATFRLPSPFGGRQTGLGTPKLENQDHINMGAANNFC